MDLVRFGTFTLDMSTGELRKYGIRMRLQGKSFEILKALLERPGRVVTREELRQRLWPADTFVDFESGLNTAVNRLRSALGDSADHPHYVETLARLGYRFVADVEATEGGEYVTLHRRENGMEGSQDHHSDPKPQLQGELAKHADRLRCRHSLKH